MTFISINMTLKNVCEVVLKDSKIREKQNELLEDFVREMIINREVDVRTRGRNDYRPGS
jgi:hypothetical protein